MDKKWKKVAMENYKALENIDPDKASKDQYILYCSSVAMLDHFEADDVGGVEYAKEPTSEAKTKIVDFVPGSQVDELLQDLLTAFIAYSTDKSEYQVVPTETNKAEMLQCLDMMLDLQRQIFELLRRSADVVEERERLEAFFKMMHKS